MQFFSTIAEEERNLWGSVFIVCSLVFWAQRGHLLAAVCVHHTIHEEVLLPILTCPMLVCLSDVSHSVCWAAQMFQHTRKPWVFWQLCSQSLGSRVLSVLSEDLQKAGDREDDDAPASCPLSCQLVDCTFRCVSGLQALGKSLLPRHELPVRWPVLDNGVHVHVCPHRWSPEAIFLLMVLRRCTTGVDGFLCPSSNGEIFEVVNRHCLCSYFP